MKVREDYAFPDLRIGQGQSECTTRSRGATSRAPLLPTSHLSPPPQHLPQRRRGGELQPVSAATLSAIDNRSIAPFQHAGYLPEPLVAVLSERLQCGPHPLAPARVRQK